MHPELHVRTKSTVLHVHRQVLRRVNAELPFLGSRNQLQCLGDRQLVGSDVVRDVGRLLLVLEVGAVPPDTSDDGHSVVVGTEHDRVHIAGVDAIDVRRQRLESRTRGLAIDPVRPEVEPRQPRLGVGLTAGDVVEIVFHVCCQGVVHQVGEVPFQQRHHRERGETRNQRRALLLHVAAVLDRRNRRRVRRWSTDTDLLHPLHQRRLGVAGRRLGLVALRRQLDRLGTVTLGHLGEDAFLILELSVRIVGAFDVGPQEPGKRDRLATRSEQHPAAAPLVGGVHRRRQTRCLNLEAYLDALTTSVGHLRCDGPLPDELVEPELLAPELRTNVLRGSEGVAGRTDRLVRLLGVLHLLRVHPRRVGKIGGAVLLGDLRSRRRQRRLRQRRRVGPHVCDEAVFVKALGKRHALRRAEAQLPARLLLERRRHERRIGLAGVGLALNGPNTDRSTFEGRPQCSGVGLAQEQRIGTGEMT